jgi:uncharacterized BrkB/YihY/UPF0761 family membrane protein
MIEVLNKFTLRSFVIITGWIGLLCFIAYGIYKNPNLIEKVFDIAFGTAITVVSFSIGKWLFGEKSG